MRIVLLAKMPTPYRTPAYAELATRTGIDLTVLYLSSREPNREWDLEPGEMKYEFLPGRTLTLGSNHFVHVNSSIFARLKQLDPEVVITSGYNVSDLVAIAWCIANRKKHISQTDGTVQSEGRLTFAHRIVRKFVKRFTTAYVSPSSGTSRLFRSWGVPESKIFRSPLAVDQAKFATKRTRVWDLLFVGRLVEDKSPSFFLDVAVAVSEILDRRIRCLIVGDGPLRRKLQAKSTLEPRVDVEFSGFLSQDQLPHVYATSKVFLLPSAWEPWAVVVNEAAASGLPIVISSFAGAAGDLVVDDDNGYVLPLEVGLWAEAVSSLLVDGDLASRMGRRSRERSGDFTFVLAADGFQAAIDSSESS